MLFYQHCGLYKSRQILLRREGCVILPLYRYGQIKETYNTAECFCFSCFCLFFGQICSFLATLINRKTKFVIIFHQASTLDRKNCFDFHAMQPSLFSKTISARAKASKLKCRKELLLLENKSFLKVKSVKLIIFEWKRNIFYCPIKIDNKNFKTIKSKKIYINMYLS